VLLSTLEVYKRKHLTKNGKTNKKISKADQQWEQKSHCPKIQCMKKRS